MGKNKRKYPSLETLLERSWCYYCERDFDDVKILINHQKARHYKCQRCGKRLDTAGGLAVHMSQVHKETLGRIENALPNRQGLEVELFGMVGIPEDVLHAHNQRVIQQFTQAEAERRTITGNPAPGSKGGVPTKRPRTEEPEDLLKRFKEFRVKKEAEKAAALAGPVPMTSVTPSTPFHQVTSQSSAVPPSIHHLHPQPLQALQHTDSSTPSFNTSTPTPISGDSSQQGHPLPQAPVAADAPVSVQDLAIGDADKEKKSKREKEKNTGSKLMYSDDILSPEEKMAQLPRYAFVRA